ncbi:Tyrosinase [Neofusicoccum parvum]|uniref:Tyrosinase n=1 Tax=Neofusicoccum parvum TaxID=310453 RepID=A0ACB5RUX0_9PEZI|nr:Tyrosinase [Neofusicoccum parvum]
MRPALGRQLLALAVSGSCLLPTVTGSPLSHDRLSHEVRDLGLAHQGAKYKRQATADTPLAITGVADSNVQVRLEVRDLAKNEVQWNLFILGMSRLQNVSQEERTSWYSMAGIHGMPFVAWDGVESEGFDRPYIALWEQTLQGLLIEIANEWPAGPEKDNYTDAANTFRFPFWDWAVLPPDGETNVPSFMTTPTIEVTMPNGTEVIDNPLYSYKFHPLDSNALYDESNKQFSVYPTTMRYPTDLTANAKPQENGVINNMNNLRPQLRDALYDLFSNYDNFTVFSNMASYHPDQYQSIEAVHGWVHNYVGGENGHMLAVPWSAFDPAFMLHHTNIDRCFAIWQALHPDSYVAAEAQDYSTFMVDAGTVQDADSALYPFHSNEDGEFWTSNSIRDVKTFGYTYPEIQNADQSALRTTINRLYGQSTVGHKTKRTATNDPIGEVVDGVTGAIKDISDTIDALIQPGQIDPDAAAKDQKRYEYTANIKIDKCALGGSGSIYLFLGDFSDNPAEWRTDDHLAGASPLFVMDNSAMSTSGVSKDIYAAVSLTRELEQRVSTKDLGCMDPSEVVPYLTKSLSWRIAKPDGSPVDASQVAGLQISIVKAEYRPATEDCEFPTRVGNYETLTQITCGKAGGLSTSSFLGLKGSH